MNIAQYKKALLAIFGGVAPILAVWGFDLSVSVEQAGGLSAGLATLLVMFGPKNAE